jgi:hypothetical protein
LGIVLALRQQNLGPVLFLASCFLGLSAVAILSLRDFSSK